jgi:hypothetical protein
MIDALGQELRIGDTVVFRRSSEFCMGIIHNFKTATTANVQAPQLVYDWIYNDDNDDDDGQPVVIFNTSYKSYTSTDLIRVPAETSNHFRIQWSQTWYDFEAEDKPEFARQVKERQLILFDLIRRNTGNPKKFKLPPELKTIKSILHYPGLC